MAPYCLGSLLLMTWQNTSANRESYLIITAFKIRMSESIYIYSCQLNGVQQSNCYLIYKYFIVDNELDFPYSVDKYMY